MAVLFAVDGGFHLYHLIVPLGKAGNLYSGAVGDLFVQQKQQFFPQNFCHHLPFRLVGGHVLRKKLGALGEVVLQHIQKCFHPLTVFGGDRHHGIEAVFLAVELDDLQQFFLLFQCVLLVDRQHSGAPQGLDPLDQLLLRFTHVRNGLYQQ